MYEFHKDRKGYFLMQEQNAVEYVIPYIEQFTRLSPNMRVMEIGCGEGGVIKAFVDKGMQGVGVELDHSRVVNANIYLKDYIENGSIMIFSKNIHDATLEEVGGAFDLIVLKDVIEHIFDQEALLEKLRFFLKPNGQIYFGFPPWIMPFGGHQQILKNKKMSLIPYTHLLPRNAYAQLLKKTGSDTVELEAMLEIYDTQISIQKFERIVKNTNFKTVDRTIYFINPIYKYKFKINPIKQWKFISAIPVLRDFLSTCAYYLVEKEER